MLDRPPYQASRGGGGRLLGLSYSHKQVLIKVVLPQRRFFFSAAGGPRSCSVPIFLGRSDCVVSVAFVESLSLSRPQSRAETWFVFRFDSKVKVLFLDQDGLPKRRLDSKDDLGAPPPLLRHRSCAGGRTRARYCVGTLHRNAVFTTRIAACKYRGHTTGEMSMRHVTGRGARNPGPDPNASYKLRYIPSAQSADRKGASFAITGAHLHKTWAAYGRCVAGAPPVWDPDFVSVTVTGQQRTNKRGNEFAVPFPACLARPRFFHSCTVWYVS